MPYVIGSPEFARFRTLAAAVSTEPPQFLQHLAAQLLKFDTHGMYYARARSHTRKHSHTHDVHHVLRTYTYTFMRACIAQCT